MPEKAYSWYEHAIAVVESRMEDPGDKEYQVMNKLVALMMYEFIEKRGIENTIFDLGLSEENAAVMFQLWEELNELISKEEGS